MNPTSAQLKEMYFEAVPNTEKGNKWYCKICFAEDITAIVTQDICHGYAGFFNHGKKHRK